MDSEHSSIQKGISRLDFVKASSATAGGLMLSSLPTAKSAYAAGSGKIKVALVGCGGRGTGAAFNALATGEDIQLVAMADAFRDRLDNSFDQLGGRYGDSEQLNVPDEHKFVGLDAYKHATDLADVVLEAAPPGFRPAHFNYAVEQGKHIFMEKPVATDAPGVRRILASGEIAREKGLNVVVGLHKRYRNSYREALKRLHNREIGDIISGQIYFNMGDLWVRERQPDQTELEYQIRNWYHFVWTCGDHIVEQHVHNIDAANWFLGEYPATAQGMGGREVRTGKEYPQIFDHHFVEYTYPSGVVIASQCRQIPGCYNREGEAFQATRGFLNMDENDNTVIRDRNKNIRYVHDGEDDPAPHQQEIDELFESIRRGNIIYNTEYGAKSTHAGIMGRMATYSGQVIGWDDALNHGRRHVPDDIGWDITPPVEPDENRRYPIAVPGEAEVFERPV